VFVSVFDIFKIGLGPSSSHTVGPMKAALNFAQGLVEQGLLDQVARIRVNLYGSLAATGKGHGSDVAVQMGLMGFTPETVDTEKIPNWILQIQQNGRLHLLEKKEIIFGEITDICYLKKETLPHHTNGMCFFAFDASGKLLNERIFYSVGGGFVVEQNSQGILQIVEKTTHVPYPFKSASDLLSLCDTHQLSIAQIVFQNELANAVEQVNKEENLRANMLNLWHVMRACMDRGMKTEGLLPGGLKILRRAPTLYQQLQQGKQDDHFAAMDWVNAFAMAVNEENACGGRVVTAPTNGAAGIIPAVLAYYVHFVGAGDQNKIVDFLLTASAIGALYKNNASISGAEVGCQGEVGVACSMAAGALCAVLGGSPAQVENAAEIGMEHNLGLTCDPVGGRVQVPCIERNAMGAVKAINAARLALKGDGKHVVSLDQVIKTMRETGADMKTKYKETSRGGLAVNVVEC
jgi:L-serine dehydratase